MQKERHKAISDTFSLPVYRIVLFIILSFVTIIIITKYDVVIRYFLYQFLLKRYFSPIIYTRFFNTYEGIMADKSNTLIYHDVKFHL